MGIEATLNEVKGLIGSRNSQYGNSGPKVSNILNLVDFSNTPLFNDTPYLVHDYILVLSKLMRGLISPTKRDHWLDAIGYLVLIIEQLNEMDTSIEK